MAFSFENLEVYKKSIDWIQEAEELLCSIKGKISRSMEDQLSRAALSVSLNIAEGNGRWHKADKRQFYWIARGSTFECVPILQVLLRKGLLDEIKYKSYYNLLEEMGKMLSGLIQSTERLEQGYSVGK